MNNTNFIITLTGPSQSGKSLVMDKINRLGKELNETGMVFIPKKIKKYTTRHLRIDEMRLIETGKETDVEYVKKIPDECDIAYQTYGVRYGFESKELWNELNKGNSPVVIINDIRVVEELKKIFSGKVLALFLFRKVPEIEDFKKESEDRGNISETEVVARYEKAVAIYRTYIENIVLFDKVILNSIEYPEERVKQENTIIDMQLKNVLLPIITGQKKLRINMEYPKSSRIFVIAGNPASGKDEIIRALLTLGKQQVIVLPKYTSRHQEPEDGKEIICQYIPRKSYLEKLRENYIQVTERIAQNLTKMDEDFKNVYKREFVDFRQKLEEKNKNEFERFWDIVTPKLKDPITKEETFNRYYEKNPVYKNLLNIKKYAKKICEDSEVGVYEKEGHRYVIYGDDNRLYGCDITKIEQILKENTFHLVIVASQIGLVNVLKKEFGEDRIRLIYAHSEISANEFEANASDIIKNEKKAEFRKRLDDYTQRISDYDHVTIYAKSQLTYEQTSKEEELIDQMFRLLRAY